MRRIPDGGEERVVDIDALRPTIVKLMSNVESRGSLFRMHGIRYAMFDEKNIRLLTIEMQDALLNQVLCLKKLVIEEAHFAVSPGTDGPVASVDET